MPKAQTKPTSAKPNKRTPRQLPRPAYKSFRMHKKISYPQLALPPARVMFVDALRMIWRHKRLFAGITVVYAVLIVLLVRGFGSVLNITETKELLMQTLEGNGGSFTVGVSLFGALIGSIGTANSEAGGAYQTILLIVMSLAIIWSLRQVSAGNSVTAKDAFYKGMYPFIPFVLVLIILTIQMLPVLIASGLYSVIFGGGLAITALEQVLWGLLFFCLTLWSLYMLTASVFALYIVTLPDMRPVQAMRSARQLVEFRRWRVMRSLLFLPFVLFILAACIMLPVLLIATPIAESLFLVLTLIATIIMHSYLYRIYRELIGS